MQVGSASLLQDDAGGDHRKTGDIAMLLKCRARHARGRWLFHRPSSVRDGLEVTSVDDRMADGPDEPCSTTRLLLGNDVMRQNTRTAFDRMSGNARDAHATAIRSCIEGVRARFGARAACMLGVLVLGLGAVASAEAVDRRVATSGNDVGDCTSAACKTVTYALAQAIANDVIIVGFGQTGPLTFGENVTVNKDVTIRGMGNNPSAATYTSLAGLNGGGPAVLTITAPNVTIENIYFAVNLNDTFQAIRAEPGADGLLVDSVRIRSEGSGMAGTYSQRNAIWINPSSSTAFSATVINSFIEGTPGPGPGTPSFFRSGIDARNAGLVATGNNIVSVNHDVSVRQQPADRNVLIQSNTFQTYGVFIANPLTGAGSATTVITGNNFVPAVPPAAPAVAGDFSAMRFIGNSSGRTVTVSGNTFNGHERGILIENFPGVTLSGNTFTPRTGSSTFQHVVLSNKELFTNDPPPQPIAQSLSLTATGNTFNAGSIAGSGAAFTLLNDNAQQPSPPFAYYGAITLSSNDFDSDLRRYVELGAFTCVDSNDAPCPLASLYTNAIGTNPNLGTPVVKFAGNVSASSGNTVDGAAIAGMDTQGQGSVLAHTQDKTFDAQLGTVDWGFTATRAEVFVDDSFPPSPVYGQALPFTHSGASPVSRTVYFGVDAFATIQDGIAAVVSTGQVYIAKGTYPAAVALSKHADLIGDGAADTNPANSTVITAGVTITASGTGSSDRLELRDLRIVNSAGDGIRFPGGGSYASIEFDGIASSGNARAGVLIEGTSSSSDIRVLDSHFDNNGNPTAPPLVAGFQFLANASINGFEIDGSSFNDNNGAGLAFNDVGGGGTADVLNVSIDTSDFSRNNPASAQGGGGGLWIKTGFGGGGGFDGISVTNSTFSDNGSDAVYNGQQMNRVGIHVRARAGTYLRNVSICGNTFTNNTPDLPSGGGTPIQEVGIYVFDQTNGGGYDPVAVCGSNVFTGLEHSVSGYEQFTVLGTRPEVTFTPPGPPVLDWEFLAYPPANPVYVDDAYAGVPNGTAVTFNHALGALVNIPAIVGVNAFATISEGVAATDPAALPRATVYVAQGDYVDNVVIPRPMRIWGDGQANTTIRPALANPDCTAGGGAGSMCTGGTVEPSVVLLGQASDIEISDLAVDGDNPAIGVPGSIEARNGIMTDFRPGPAYTNFLVHDTTVRNIYLRGIYSPTSGLFEFRRNTVEYVDSDLASIAIFTFTGSGIIDGNTVRHANDAIAANHSYGTHFTNNSVSDAGSGIHSDNSHSGPPGTGDLIEGNTIDCQRADSYGAWSFVPYREVVIRNNTVTSCAVGLGAFGGRPDPGPIVDTVFEGNSVDGTGATVSAPGDRTRGAWFSTTTFGYHLSDNSVELTGNTITGYDDAIVTDRTDGRSLATEAHFNRIVGNDAGWVDDGEAVTPTNGVSDFENNWWGCNQGPNHVSALCDTATGTGDFNPWLVLSASASPAVINSGDPSAITVDLTHNSDNAVPAGNAFPNGIGVGLTASKGALTPAAPYVTTSGALPPITLTGHTSGYSFLAASLDSATVNFTVVVSGAVTVNDCATPAACSAQNESLPATATCGAPDFTTIQSAINTVAAGTTILVCPGTYAEGSGIPDGSNLVVNKTLTLRGAQSGENAGVGSTTRPAVNESIIVPASPESALTQLSANLSVVQIDADGVVFDGFLIDTDNAALTGNGINLNGANPDVSSGIFATSNGSTMTNLVVRNGMFACIAGYAPSGARDSNVISNSFFTNCDAYDPNTPSFGIGLVVLNNYYAKITSNRMAGVGKGVQTNNFNVAAPTPGYVPEIAGNAIEASRVGIWHNLFYQNAQTWSIANNNLTRAVSSRTSQWNGVWVESMQDAQTATISGNTINGAGLSGRPVVGYLLNNVVSSAASTSSISGGSVNNVDVGVLATDATFYTGAVNDYLVSGVNFSYIALAAFYIEDTAEVTGSAKLTLAGNGFGSNINHKLALAGATAGVDIDSDTVDDVFVRSTRNYFFDLPGSAPCTPANCTVANAVINTGIAAASVNGTVTVEDGSFDQNVLVTKPLTLVGPFQTIPGYDGSRTGTGEAVIAPASGHAVVVDADNVVIAGLTFSPALGVGVGGGANINAHGPNTSVDIRNNRFVGLASSGVHTDGPNPRNTAWTVENNLFRNFPSASTTAINLWNIDGGVIRGNRIENAGRAIQIESASNVDVEANRIDGTQSHAIQTGTVATDIDIFDNLIANANTSAAADRAAIRLYAESDDISVTCNAIEASSNGGIAFRNGTASAVRPRVFHNRIPATRSLVTDLAAGGQVGSNWYFGGAANVVGTQVAALQVADPLSSDPTNGGAFDVTACGDNSPVALVLYPASGSGQQTPLNQPFANPLRARVQDALGGAVVGETVNVTAPGAGASAGLTATIGGTLPNLVTDFNGVVETTAIANGFAGTYNVTASHSTNNVAFALQNTALQQVQFDLNGPVGGVEVGDEVPYTGRIFNQRTDINENVVIAGVIDATVNLTQADILQFCVITGLPAPNDCAAIPLADGNNDGNLEFVFDDGMPPAGFDIEGSPYNVVPGFTHQFRISFGRAATYVASADIRGVSTSTIYASDVISTEVIAPHADVSLDLTGPIAGVERDVATDYSARVRNESNQAVGDNVAVELVLTRTGGIVAADVTVEYDNGGGYALLPLDNSTPGQLVGVLDPATLTAGYNIPSALRITYHVAPHTFSIAGTLIDAVPDTDGVATYAADTLSTDVIEADPSVDVTLSGMFDDADGTTPVATHVAETVVMRGELTNTGGNVPDQVQASFTLSPDFTGIAATDVIATYGFVPSSLDCPASPAAYTESVAFTDDGDTLSVSTDPQTLAAGFDIAVCFRLEFRRAGVYAIGSVIEDAVPDTDGQPQYAGDTLNVTVGKGAATVTLASLGPHGFDGNPHPATASAVDPDSAPITPATFAFTYNGSAPEPVNVGSYAVTATLVNADWEGSASGTLTITASNAATVTFDAPSLAQVYNGTPRAATATTTPNGLPLSFSYSRVSPAYGPTTVPPTDAGSYSVTATITDPNYTGSGTATLVIAKAQVTALSFGNLSHVYDGSAKAASASSTPGGVAGISLAYAPSDPPVNAGSYTVTASISNINYEFAPALDVDDTLTIAKATAQVTLSNLVQVFDNTVKSVTVSTAPASLPVTLVYVPASPQAIGSYAVTGTVNHPNYAGSASATLQIVAAAPASITLDLVPTSNEAVVGTAFGASAADDLCAVVEDAFGQPVEGIDVTFAAPASGASAVLSSVIDSTDVTGSACVAADANTVAGSYLVSASISGGALSDSQTLVNNADTTAAQVELTILAGNGQTSPVGDVFGIDLELAATDRFGNVLIGAGYEPVFTVPGSEPTASVTAAVDAEPDGVWVATATAGAFAGSYDVVATLGSAVCTSATTCSASFHLSNTTAAPADVELVSDVASNTVGNPGGAYVLTATVEDAGGAGVSGVSVTFVVEPGAGGAGTTVSNAVGMTNASGVASASLSANHVAGAFTVRAVVSGVSVVGSTPDHVDLTNVADVADHIVLVSGNNQSAVVSTAFAPLVVRVVDQFENPVADAAAASVSFTANGTTANATVDSPVASGAGGLASSNAAANTTAGSYTVTAAFGSGPDVVFNLTNTLGNIAISDIRWAANDLASIAYSGGTQAATFTGNPSSGVTCSVNYNGATTLPQDAGSYLVQVSCNDGAVGGLSGSGSATLTITPASVTITFGAAGPFTYDGTPQGPTASAGSAPVTVLYSGVAPTVYGPSPIPPTNAGSYSATASVNDPNYSATPVTQPFSIAPKAVTVSFTNLSHVYDGSVKSATATFSDPLAGTPVLTYVPAPPTTAGSYAVTASLTNPNYTLSGDVDETLVIAKATAQITLSNLTQIFDGNPKPVLVTTAPPSLGVNVTYAGNPPPAPSAVGSYPVVATIVDANYQGTASDTLTILAAGVAQFVTCSSSTVNGTAGAPLATGDRPCVRVLDNNGNGVAGISILFNVTGGGGSATGTSATTAADGRATVASWTLGANAGVNTMTAQVNGLAGLPTHTFTANGAELAGVSMSKSSATTQAMPGDAITYSLVVTHAAGSSNAAAVDILDALPAQLDVGTATWLCAGTGGATCSVPNGTGDVDVTAAIPVGASVTVTLTATVRLDATLGAMLNTATAELTSSTDPDTSNNTDDHSITLVPRPDGPCSVFCDGFEGDDIVKAMSVDKALRAEQPITVTLPGLASGVTPLFELLGTDAKAIATLDVLAVGESRWFRLRHRDVQGQERFTVWSPLAADAVGFDWALDVDGVALRGFAHGRAEQLSVPLEAGQPLPQVLRAFGSRH